MSESGSGSASASASESERESENDLGRFLLPDILLQLEGGRYFRA